METKTAKKDLMEVILNMYDYHTKLFSNAIEGISDNDASNRLGTKANHVAWLAGSLVQERYQL
ncbi:MAG: DinB family protein, partial [Chitinophagales bacterium]